MAFRKLRIAAVQAAPAPLDSGLSAFSHHLDGVLRARPGVDLVAYPELHLFGSDRPDPADRRAELNAAAEPLDGARCAELGRIAAAAGVWLVPGTVCERGPDGELFNTTGRVLPDRPARGHLSQDLSLAPVRALRLRHRVRRLRPPRRRDDRAQHLLRRLVSRVQSASRLVRSGTDPQPCPDHDAGSGPRARPCARQRHRQPGVRGQRELRRSGTGWVAASSSTPRGRCWPSRRTPIPPSSRSRSISVTCSASGATARPGT